MSAEEIKIRDEIGNLVHIMYPDRPIAAFSGTVELSQTRRGVTHADIEMVHGHHSIGDESYVSTSRVEFVNIMADGKIDVLVTKNTVYIRRDMPKDL